MNNKFKCVIVLPVLAILGACAAPSQVYHSADALPAPIQPSLLILPSDVVISIKTAGGTVEPRADWTETVSANLGNALQEHLYNNGVRFVEYGDQLLDQDVSIVRQTNVLLDAIELSQVKQMIGSGREYQLGESEVTRLQEFGTDYALLIVLRANRASGGRQAVAVLAAIGGVAVDTSSATFRSGLIDLRDGHIKWANFDPYALADIGDPVKSDNKRWAEAVAHLLREAPL